VVLAALAITASMVSVAGHRYLFPLLSGDRDEGVYVFQAHMLLHGKLTLPAARYGEFFRPWLSGERHRLLFTEYQFGLPALLAAFVAVLGSVHTGVAAAAGLTVLAIYGFTDELLGDTKVALTAAAIYVVTPIFMVQSALVLTYGVTVLCLLSAGWALLRGARLTSVRYFVVGGLFIGAVVLTRPFDALLFGVPVAPLVLVRLERAQRLRLLVRAGAAVALGILPFVAVTLWYNAATTGSLLSFPNNTADPLNTFGFGARRLLPTEAPMYYDLPSALSSLGANLWSVPSWLFGGPAALVLCVIGLAGSRLRRGERLVLLAMFAIFPAGYLFWWATRLSAAFGANGLGPHYYLPGMVGLVVLSALGLVRIATRPAITIATGVALVAATGWAVPDKITDARRTTDQYEHVKALVPPNLDHALVFIHDKPYLLAAWPFLQDQPDLDGRIVYAIDRGVRDVDLMQQMPERTAYRLRPEYRPSDRRQHPTAGFDRLAVVSGRRLRISIEPRSAGPGESARTSILAGAVTATTPGARSWVLATAGGASPGDLVIDSSPGAVTPVLVELEQSSTPNYAITRRWRVQLWVETTATGQLVVVTPGLGARRAELVSGATWLDADVSSALDVHVAPIS